MLSTTQGIIQTGAWLILYDFNVIDVEVLSVIAQQISAIHKAKAERALKIMFDDSPLKLDNSCNILATINTQSKREPTQIHSFYNSN